MYPVYDFLARYVRKLHADRYIKKTLAANPGRSYLQVIGPSDIAYVIAVLKNSISVWKYDIHRPEGRAPRPLYTRGENMKRECGKTAWNEDGINYYKDALKKWKKVYSTPEYFAMMNNGWAEWLRDVGSHLNPPGWTRKDLSRLLATREVGERPDVVEGGDLEDSESEEVEYDSEDDGAPMVGPGGARRGGEEENDDDDDDENIILAGGGGGGGRRVGPGGAGRGGREDDDEDDDNADSGRQFGQPGGARRGGREEADDDDDAGDENNDFAAGARAVGAAVGGRRRIVDDDASDEDEEVQEEPRERGTKTTGEDDEEEDNRGGGNNVRVRLFRNDQEDDIEDDDDGDEEAECNRGQGRGGNKSNAEKQKRKRKKRGQLQETGGSGESVPKKPRSSGRTITKKTK